MIVEAVTEYADEGVCGTPPRKTTMLVLGNGVNGVDVPEVTRVKPVVKPSNGVAGSMLSATRVPVPVTDQFKLPAPLVVSW